MTRPLVSLVTVNYNGRELLAPFLDSVAEQQLRAHDLELIVVDNGSTDDSADFVERRLPDARVVRNSANLGFARGSNQGARVASGRYLAFLNNDMRLHPQWIATMARYLDDAPADVVCAGSLILNWDGSRIDFGGATMAFNGVGFQVRADEPYCGGRMSHPDEILFACGGAMMVDRAVYLDAGGFDDDYFAYLEDVDFGWRLWLLGYRVGFCPEAIVYHLHNGTARHFPVHRRFLLQERNALATVVKNYEDATLALAFPAALLLAVKRFALRSRFSREDFRFVDVEPPPVVSATKPSAWAKLLWVSRHYGMVGTFRKVVAKAIRPLSGRAAAALTPPQPALSSPEPGRHVSHRAYGTIAAIEDLADMLPELFEKRRRIQAARQRSDHDLVRVFGAPFRVQELPEGMREAYGEAQESIIGALGLRDYLASAFEPAGATPSTR